MAAVTATDVAYSSDSVGAASTGDSKNIGTFKLVFGAGLTYPTGGVPLTKAKLGCPNVITNFEFLDSGNAVGILMKYNYTANTVRMYQDPGGTAAAANFAEVSTAATLGAITLYVRATGW